MGKNLFAIDGNALGYHSQNRRRLSNGGKETQAVFHFLADMQTLHLEHSIKDWSFIVLWDSHTQWRYDLLPEYKSNRDRDPKAAKMRESYRQQRPLIQQALRHLGVAQWTVPDYEADDLAGALMRLAEQQDRKMIMFTKDHDWLQLVRPWCWWQDIETRRIVRPDNFEQQTGYRNPDEFLQKKLLMGDSSDTVPGIGGIGNVGAPQILQHFGGLGGLFQWFRDNNRDLTESDVPKDLKRYLAVLNGLRDPKSKEALALRRNNALMNLTKVTPPTSSPLDRGLFDIEKLEELFLDLGFSSFVSRLEVFVSPFLTKEQKHGLEQAHVGV